jgi:hypothetical protein
MKQGHGTSEKFQETSSIKAKIQAAVESKLMKALLMDLVEVHWQELERKGILPKGK